MTMALVEEAWVRWKLLGFRQTVGAVAPATLQERRKLAQAHDRAQARYWRRRAAYLAGGGAPW